MTPPHPTLLRGELETPRPLTAEGGQLSLSGWCLFAGQAEPPRIRLSTAAGLLATATRVERPDLVPVLPDEPAAGGSGFSLSAKITPGVHVVALEALLPEGQWRVFKTLTVAALAPPFAAVLDEPISTGVLRDRVKVGGWALDPTRPVTELSLRYGHREIACQLGLPRHDVAAAFPELPQAGRPGFVSEDFLVAGCGPVRVKARLQDGRTVVASTPVSFAIATDENHGPELDLTAPRIGLDPVPAPPAEPPPARTDRPRNLLFILPGSFASNSALHVVALANELAAAGHACAVAVSHDLGTLAHHEHPAFRGLLHAEAETGVVFPDGRGPDFVHAWTTRENVRRLSETLRARHGARVLVHLEDNEQQILALSLRRPWAELNALPAAELDRLVPDDLSHPHRSAAFLAAADGVTIITDRLRDFVPAGIPVHMLWPAADARYFYPRPRPDAFRAVLDAVPGTTVLFYHGNVHAANAAEVRELYAAVLALNRTGTPTTLIRAGLDTEDFLGDLAPAVAPHVLALGQILQHRYLARLMALADLFVQPGGADAFNDYRFPSKLPEFFALGRPVILPRTNLGELVRHGEDAFVLDRADATGIADAVRTLRRDPALAARLSAGAAAFARGHLSWRRSAEGLASFHQSLAGS